MRAKKQPTAEVMRQQLALAADEIIRLRFVQDMLIGDARHRRWTKFDLNLTFAIGFATGAACVIVLAWWLA